jgi:3-hydroxyisobutyrate dehydrogenase-like beta-hydroxyacid dehydrogenase
MSDISVIGLGLMGTALARAIQRAGHGLVVWNRSPGKMQPFQADGIRCASDLLSAVLASPVVLICIDNYATTRSMFDTPDIAPSLRGKVVVQLSSGTPKEAFDAADWAHAHGASYLDGAILAGPSNIGTSDATILLSGDEAAHARSIGLLECLGQGTVRYHGSNVRAASTLDLAWLTSRYGNFMAAIHAANLCQSEGVGVDEFIALVPDNPSLQHYTQVIHEGHFDDFTASLQVWSEALLHIQQQGIDAAISTEIPDFIAGLFDRALEAGYAQKNVMSLIKVLQENR